MTDFDINKILISFDEIEQVCTDINVKISDIFVSTLLSDDTVKN